MNLVVQTVSFNLQKVSEFEQGEELGFVVLEIGLRFQSFCLDRDDVIEDCCFDNVVYST